MVKLKEYFAPYGNGFDWHYVVAQKLVPRLEIRKRRYYRTWIAIDYPYMADAIMLCLHAEGLT